MNTSLARQWEILRIIPNPPNSISAREIMEKLALRDFEVSKRTVERDLRDLSAIFPIGSLENSQPFKWYWVKDIGGEIKGLCVDEVISLSLADDVLKEALPESFFTPLKKHFEFSNKKIKSLEELSVSKLRYKFRYVPQALPFKKVSVPKPILEVIKSSLIKNKQVFMRYDPKAKATKSNILNPLGLVQVGVRPYLIANVEGKLDIIAFALQRIRKIELLDTPSISPKGFSLDEYIASDAMQFGQCLEVKLKAFISESLATYLEESAISSDQKIRYEDGKCKLCATVKDSWSLYLWLRSQFSEITVISPKRLRDKLVADIKTSMENYNID